MEALAAEVKEEIISIFKGTPHSAILRIYLDNVSQEFMMNLCDKVIQCKDVDLLENVTSKEQRERLHALAVKAKAKYILCLEQK